MSVNNLLIKLKQEGYRVETQPNEEIEGTNKLIITKGEDSYYEELYKGLLDGSLTSFKVPASITSLASYRFATFTDLKEIDLTGITEIPDYLCFNCPNVDYFKLNTESIITALNSYCFSRFGYNRESPENNIFEFDFRNSTFNSIGQNAFEGGTSITANKYFNIQFPVTLNSIGDNVFQYTDHFNIYFNSAIVPTIQSNTFLNITNNKIFVPYNIINTYKTATNWTTIADSIYGFVNENTLEAGYVLPTTNDEGLNLKWYSNVDMTNAVTAVEDTTIKYYCKINTVVNTPFSSFEIDGNTITKFVGSETDVVIPSSYSIDGYTPNTLTIDNKDVFEYYCSENRDYLMENSVNVTFADGNTVAINYDNYMEYARQEYFPATAVIGMIPNIVDGNDYSITSIGNSAFYGNENLRSVAIPNTVTSIGNGAFGACSNLTNVIIPDSVTSIEDSAFSRCSRLTSITIPSNLIYIKNNVFTNCNGLSNVDFSKATSLTRIGIYAFQNCDSLTSIIIPSSVTSIGAGAFQNCDSLTSIIIPSSVTSIEYSAFQDCISLTSVIIPSSVISIEHAVFEGCDSLTNIIVDENNTKYDSRDNCNAIIETATNTLIMGCQSTIIPNTITSIGGFAFGGFDSLTSITIPSSVTSVGDWAFQDCNSLTSITIPSSVTSVGNGAFSNCNSLHEMTIQSTTPPALSNTNAISSATTTIYIPHGTLSAYQSATNWSSFASKFVELNEDGSIPA